MTMLGSSGLEIHPVVLGGNTFGWTSDESESHRVLDAFIDAGGTLVDTADSYSAWAEGNKGGESERVIGSWLAGRGRRDDVLIATKVSQHPEFRGLAASNVKAAAEASLKRLGTDHIDIYYAHFDDADTPLEDTVGAFDALVEDGKVRYVGVSNYGPDRLRRWLEIAEETGAAPPVALQPHYSLVHRKTVEPELRDIAVDAGMGMVPYYALASGFLTGKYRTESDLVGRARAGAVGRHMGPEGLAVVDRLVEIADARGVAPATVALAWVLGRPGMAGVLASARTTEQLPALMDAARVSLSGQEADALTRASDAVGD